MRRFRLLYRFLFMRVWTEAWEWQCCGDPFKVGSDVIWGLVPASEALKRELGKQLGDEVAAEITHYETHHEDDDEVRPSPTRGRIEAIHAVYWTRAAAPEAPQVYESVPGTGVLEERDNADGWESDDEAGNRLRSFEGYIVTLAPVD